MRGNRNHGVVPILARVLARYSDWDGVSTRAGKRHATVGVVDAFLLPGAVLLLTIQIFALPHGGTGAILMIALELLCLIAALAIPFTGLGVPREEWVRSRLRTELLRRERYLVMARVGPYLKVCSLPDLGLTANSRVAELLDEGTSPMRALLPQSVHGRSWRDELEDCHAVDPGASAPPMRNCVRRYLKRRITRQRVWFESNRTWFEATDAKLQRIADLVLVLAVVTSAMHLMALITGAGGEEGGRSVAQTITEAMAIVLPVVGSAAAGLRPVYEGRRVSRVYRMFGAELRKTESALEALLATAEETGAADLNDDNCLRFKRLVIEAEDLLAGELRQWGSIVLD